MTLLCVCGVDSFIPELEHWIENPFLCLFSKKKPLKSDSWIQIHEMKLRSTSSAEKKFPDEITWITWKSKQNLEIWPFLNSLLEKWVWDSGPKIDPAPVLKCLACCCAKKKKTYWMARKRSGSYLCHEKLRYPRSMKN